MIGVCTDVRVVRGATRVRSAITATGREQVMSEEVVVTPVHVERRLLQLSKELDDASQQLHQAEHLYMESKTAYEINAARARMQFKQHAIHRGVKVTVQEIEDESLIACTNELTALNTSEAIVRSARSNVARVRTQIDIARSIGTSVRASMEVV